MQLPYVEATMSAFWEAWRLAALLKNPRIAGIRSPWRPVNLRLSSVGPIFRVWRIIPWNADYEL